MNRCISGRCAARGMSLVSLMVGLLIASIAIAGLLMGYKATATTTAQAALAARNAGEWTSALLSTDLNLQGAGYGLASPTVGTHLALLSGATVDGTNTLHGTFVALPSSGAVSGNALLWADQTGSAPACHGLLLPQDGSGAIYTLAKSSCSTASDLSGWTATQLAAPTVARDAAAASSPVMAVATGITAEETACAPMGIGAPAKSVLVTITRAVALSDTKTSCSLSDADCQVVNVDSTCLVNFSPS